MVPVAAPRVSPLLGLVLENPAKACWCKPAVISDPCTCALIAWAAAVRGVEHPLELNCATCLCDAGLISWLLPPFKTPGLLVGLLPTDGLEGGVPLLCFLAVAPALERRWVGDGDVLEGVCLPKLPVLDLGIGWGEDNGWLLGAGPGDELVRFRIGISTGGDSADDGDETGVRKGGACTSGEAGEDGDADWGEPTIKVALWGVRDDGGEGECGLLVVLGGDWLKKNKQKKIRILFQYLF